MKLKALKTDLVKAAQGVWIDKIPDMEDLRLKVRPESNPDFRRVYSQLTESVPRHQKRGGIVTDHAVKSNIMARALADTILVGWENFEDDSGQPLTYDPETAKAMLLDPEYAALRDAVAWAAGVAAEEVIGAAAEKAGK